MSTKVILFGASKLGRLAHEYLEDRYEIIYYCDNNYSKVGEKFNNLEIISVDKLLELVLNEEVQVIISSQYYEEIEKQLVDKGVDKKKIKVFYNNLEYLQTIEDIKCKKEDMKSVSSYKENIYNKNIFAEYNVHLMHDSIFCQTFIDEINKEYEKEKNIFIIYNDSQNSKYIDYESHENVEIIDKSNYKAYGKLYTYIYGCNKLFIHSLTDNMCELLHNFEIEKMSCEKNWILWGGDLYNYIDFNMYEEKTLELIKDKNYYLDNKVYMQNQNKLCIRKDVIKCIDNIMFFNKNDYKLIKENFDTNSNYIEFQYKSNIDFEKLEQINKNNDKSFKEKYSFEYLFLLGNSSTWENNHIDIFHMLKRLKSENFGIVLPLSYGNKTYALDVINEGKVILGDRLIVLYEFLNSYEYYNIVNQVDAVIMNHIRQQGVGNIVGALYLGKKVYLNNKSSVYKFCLDKNIKIDDTSKLNEMDIEKIVSIDIDSKLRNKELIYEDFNVKRKKNMKNILK